MIATLLLLTINSDKREIHLINYSFNNWKFTWPGNNSLVINYLLIENGGIRRQFLKHISSLRTKKSKKKVRKKYTLKYPKSKKKVRRKYTFRVLFWKSKRKVREKYTFSLLLGYFKVYFLLTFFLLFFVRNELGY